MVSCRGVVVIFSNFFLNKGDAGTIKIKKNISASFLLKGISVMAGFLLVPITIDYLNPVNYGIWITLSSIIAWFGFFDIGIGNGLRNKLSESLALKNYKEARIYISTTYAIISLIIIAVYIFFLFINIFLDWSEILNSTSVKANELSLIAIIVFTFFIIQFILQLINIVFIADQLPAYKDAFEAAGSVLSLLFIFIITKTSHEELLFISIIYGATPVVILAIATFYFFRKKYKAIRPSFKFVDFKYFYLLASLGIKFFVLQVAMVVIFTTDNMIITQVLGPKDVTIYNISFKYFSIPVMIFSIITAPYWSAFTVANLKKDKEWVKVSIKNLIKIWSIITIITIIMLVYSNEFYSIWIGDAIRVPYLLSTVMAIYVVIITWNNLFSVFLNGIGKIKIQMYDAIIGMIINIPISIFFADNLGMGSVGVILGTCTSLSLGIFLAPIQVFKLTQGNPKGIWNQ
jgi:O-antigen/teichoic acid export membrane protein